MSRRDTKKDALTLNDIVQYRRGWLALWHSKNWTALDLFADAFRMEHGFTKKQVEVFSRREWNTEVWKQLFSMFPAK
jgi:hypothetical protein